MNFSLDLSNSESVRRQLNAKPFRGSARVCVEGGKALLAQQVRIGDTGANLIVGERLPEDATCAVHLKAFIDGVAHHVQAPARVVSCSLAGMDGFRIALRFTELDPNATAALKKWSR